MKSQHWEIEFAIEVYVRGHRAYPSRTCPQSGSACSTSQRIRFESGPRYGRPQ